MSGSFPSINIVGAGIAGLSLACHLRRCRIPFNIFDAASKPKGHNYGLTISPWGFNGLLGAAEPRLTAEKFRELIAVDKLIGGQGKVSGSDKVDAGRGENFRARDMSLRELLARQHEVQWNHKVVSTESSLHGLRLRFENGSESTATITVDAGGERSHLTNLLLPESKPEVLAYAVYHGSRYLSQSSFDSNLGELFGEVATVRNFELQNSKWHLQLAKSYITKSQLPSAVHVEGLKDGESIVELRYTLSRPSASSNDPLYNPSRAKDEAKNIPSRFFDEVEEYVTSASLPSNLEEFLTTKLLQQDRILNWLMRIKQPDRTRLHSLASKGVIAIGDATHSMPPLESEGASLAMADAALLAALLQRLDGEKQALSQQLPVFYEERIPIWEKAIDASRRRLENLHAKL